MCEACRKPQIITGPLDEATLRNLMREVFSPQTSPEEDREESINLTVNLVQTKLKELEGTNLSEEKKRLWVSAYLSTILPSDGFALAYVDMALEIASLRATIEAKERALETLREENRKAYRRIKDLSRPLGIRPGDVLRGT